MSATELPEAEIPVVYEGCERESCARAAADLLRAATTHSVTLAIAESLTGGQVSSSLVEIPGASRVLVGAVVAYATRIKAQVLGVDAAHLERTGPVDRDVALQRARGVRRLLGPIWGWRPPGSQGPGRLTPTRRERCISPSLPRGERLTASCIWVGAARTSGTTPCSACSAWPSVSCRKKAVSRSRDCLTSTTDQLQTTD